MAEALKVAEAKESELRVHKLDVIGELVLNHLLKIGKVNTAASICPRVLRDDAASWEACCRC